MSDVTLFDEIAERIGSEGAKLVVGLLSKFAEVKIERRQRLLMLSARTKTTQEILGELSRSGLQNVGNKFIHLGDGYCIVVTVTPVETELIVAIRTADDEQA